MHMHPAPYSNPISAIHRLVLGDGIVLYDLLPISPSCIQDWEWVEEGWQIDMTGLLENAVDEEGWTYAVDFAWITWPPGPGSGRFRKVVTPALPQQQLRCHLLTYITLLACKTGLSQQHKTSVMKAVLNQARALKGAGPRLCCTCRAV